MPIATMPKGDATILTATELLHLANFSDEQDHALSFYFGNIEVPDRSHREDVIAIKNLIKQAKQHMPQKPLPAPLAEDLNELLATAQDFAMAPVSLKSIFACREKGLWREFDIPVQQSISLLEAGRRFRLAPLLKALQECDPYSVVLLESGKARAFVIRGMSIRELQDQLPNDDLNLHVDDSRVGWSSHIDRDREEREKAYFRKLVTQLAALMAQQGVSKLIVGCREDLWGEIGPQFAGFSYEIAGRFHLTSFDITAAETHHLAAPIFKEWKHQSFLKLLNEIREGSSRVALGVRDVLYSLSEGRVHKLVMGNLLDQTISECLDCHRMWAEGGDSCAFCRGNRVGCMETDEALLRQAVVTGAELFFAEPNEIPGFSSVAALLRY